MPIAQQNHIIFFASSSTFLSCVMCHILRYTQPILWLRTALASLCRSCHITSVAALDCEHNTHRGTHFPNPLNPRVVAKS